MMIFYLQSAFLAKILFFCFKAESANIKVTLCIEQYIAHRLFFWFVAKNARSGKTVV